MKMTVLSSASKLHPFATSLLYLWFLANFFQKAGAHPHPTECPGNVVDSNDNKVLGYSEWKVLQEDLKLLSSANQTKPAKFVICPGTTFSLGTAADTATGNSDSAPLYVSLDRNLPSITIQCGVTGTSTENCIVRGGMHHVWIDQVGEMIFRGIQFQQAERGSIWTGIRQSRGVHFEDCRWEGNSFEWNSPSENQCPTGCAAVLGGHNGAASFRNCQFKNNIGNSGAIHGLNMQLSFDSCVFEENTASWRVVSGQPTGSAITLLDPSSTLSISNSCFVDNVSYGGATISYDGSSSASNPSLAENYFDSNRAAMPILDDSYYYCRNGIYRFDNVDTDNCILPTGPSVCCLDEPNTETKNEECPEPRGAAETVTDEKDNVSPETTLQSSTSSVRSLTPFSLICVLWMAPFLTF